MSDPVVKHFHSTADEFDTIYTGKKGRFARWLDQRLRWDMYERLRRTVEVIRQHDSPTVLDVGAGTGRFFKPMLEAGARHIVAVEPAERMVAIARELIADQGISDKITFVTLPFMDAAVDYPCDVSIAIGFYDYIPNIDDHLRKVRGLTKQTMVASFPRAGTWRAAVRERRLKLRGCPSYYFSREQLEKALRESGYRSWEVQVFGQLLFVIAKV